MTGMLLIKQTGGAGDQPAAVVQRRWTTAAGASPATRYPKSQV